jgi:hypothetical protein
MALIRTLYRRRPWIDLELHHWPWGSSSEREERGTGRGRGGGGLGAPWGGAARRSSTPAAPVRSARLFGPAVSRREGGTREEKEKQGKKKEEKMWNFFQTWKFEEKNKRQYMKLIKKLFL